MSQSDYEIRPANEADIPAMLTMGRRFFDASGYGRFTEFNEGVLAETFRRLIDSDTGVIWVADAGPLVGFTGGLLYPFYFSGRLTGQELFWWVDEEYRGGGVARDLFKALESWAKSLGAETFGMVALEALSPERVGGMYQKAGYVPAEHAYMRRL